MTAIVLGGSYRSTAGRKPSRPAFMYDFHNDAAGGTAVVDRFGNAPNLTIGGTVGTMWSASRGWWRPSSNYGIISSDAANYVSNQVLDVVTPGGAIIVAYRMGWAGTKPSSVETVLTMGRSATNSAVVQFSHNAPTNGLAQIGIRGVGASSVDQQTFGGGGDYSSTADICVLHHLEINAAGFIGNCFVNGVSVGQERTFLWATNGGAAPSASTFALPDGISVGVLRGSTNPASPTFTQLMLGSGTTGGTRLANLLGLSLGSPNIGTAQDLALELYRYPRHTGEVMAGL